MGYSFNRTLMIFFSCLSVCGCDEIETQGHGKETKYKKQEVCKYHSLSTFFEQYAIILFQIKRL